MSEQRLTLADGLQAPAHARAWTAAQLPPLPSHIAEDALLLVSELVTNAVRHGRPAIEITLGITPERVRVEVRDGGDALPVVPSGQPSIDRPTGRGLLIVAATASDWGIERSPGTAGQDGVGRARRDHDAAKLTEHRNFLELALEVSGFGE